MSTTAGKLLRILLLLRCWRAFMRLPLKSTSKEKMSSGDGGADARLRRKAAALRPCPQRAISFAICPADAPVRGVRCAATATTTCARFSAAATSSTTLRGSRRRPAPRTLEHDPLHPRQSLELRPLPSESRETSRTPGNRLKGSNSLGASWVMADMYDRFTGLLLPFELRQMQCFINSSNGYKPNIADDVIRDVTAYSRFLSAAYRAQDRQSLPRAGHRTRFPRRQRKAGRRLRARRILSGEMRACVTVRQAFGPEVKGRCRYPRSPAPTPGTCSRAIIPIMLDHHARLHLPQHATGAGRHAQQPGVPRHRVLHRKLPRPAGDKQGPLMACRKQQALMTVMPLLMRLWNHTASRRAWRAAPLHRRRDKQIAGRSETAGILAGVPRESARRPHAGAGHPSPGGRFLRDACRRAAVLRHLRRDLGRAVLRAAQSFAHLSRRPQQLDVRGDRRDPAANRAAVRRRVHRATR